MTIEERKVAAYDMQMMIAEKQKEIQEDIKAYNGLIAEIQKLETSTED